MYKLAVENHYIRDKLSEHEFVKPQILGLIEQMDDGNLVDYGQGEENNITKLDWKNHANFERPWVKILLPILIAKLGQMVYTMGYDGVLMKAMWYQQYEKDSIHGWHVHSENYTGVYYLEYPTGAPATELWDNKQKIPSVSEGDVVMFPAMTPHRAPLVTSDIRKTIISYNFNVHKLSLERLEEFKNV